MTSATDAHPPAFPHVLETLEDLRPLFRDPVPLVANKIASSIDEHTTRYLQACPLAFLATSNAAGRTVVSPRGGERGFIKVLEGSRLLFADVVGNNLVESHQNIVETGQIGLLCVLPGQSETLRVDGRAWLTQDPDMLDMLTPETGKRPKLATGIQVEHVYTHCSKSFERSGVWNAETWSEDTGVDIAQVYFEHLRSNGFDYPGS